jgi:hypothetical protein
MTRKNDPVNYPSHYNNGKVEAIEAIEASMSTKEFRGYLKGAILKYLWRYTYKDRALEDLLKARWYLDKLISGVRLESIENNEITSND